MENIQTVVYLGANNTSFVSIMETFKRDKGEVKSTFSEPERFKSIDDLANWLRPHRRKVIYGSIPQDPVVEEMFDDLYWFKDGVVPSDANFVVETPYEPLTKTSRSILREKGYQIQ